MWQALIALSPAMAKGPGQRPQTASQEGTYDKDEASREADGAFTVKDDQDSHSKNRSIFYQFTHPLEFRPVRRLRPVRDQWPAPDRTGQDRFQWAVQSKSKVHRLNSKADYSGQHLETRPLG